MSDEFDLVGFSRGYCWMINQSEFSWFFALSITLETHQDNTDFDLGDMGDLDGDFDLGDMDLGDDLDLDNDFLGKLLHESIYYSRDRLNGPDHCPLISEIVINFISDSPNDNDESSMNFDLENFGDSSMDQSLDKAFGKLIEFTSRMSVFLRALGDKSVSDDSQTEGVTYAYDMPAENSEQNLAPKSLKSIMQKPSNSKPTLANNVRQVSNKPLTRH